MEMKEVYLVMRREHFGIDFYDYVVSAHSSAESAKAEAKELQDWDNKLPINKTEYTVLPTKFTQAETTIQKKLNIL